MNPTETPDASRWLRPAIISYLEPLALEIDRANVAHPEQANAMGAWISENLKSGEPLSAIVVCTGNSRRSILGSTMGNLAASYFGLPEVRFFSGGTDPTAFNPRTITALRAIGVEIEPTGDEAPGVESNDPNLVYRMCWGHSEGLGLEAIEFSKRYDHGINPHSGFAALMVCDEADAGCPVVPGASLRLSIPFADPKSADGTAEEANRYNERRDDLARWMLRAFSVARRHLNH